MIAHPTHKGVAIAVVDDAFRPTNGFHDPIDTEPQPCPEIDDNTTYHSERNANARLIAAAPDLVAALEADAEATRLYQAATEFAEGMEGCGEGNTSSGSMAVTGAFQRASNAAKHAEQLKAAALARAQAQTEAGR